MRATAIPCTHLSYQKFFFNLSAISLISFFSFFSSWAQHHNANPHQMLATRTTFCGSLTSLSDISLSSCPYDHLWRNFFQSGSGHQCAMRTEPCEKQNVHTGRLSRPGAVGGHPASSWVKLVHNAINNFKLASSAHLDICRGRVALYL